jgi:hypothetical protein
MSITITPFKSSIDATKCFQDLKKNIHLILSNKTDSISYEECYRNCYNVCLGKEYSMLAELYCFAIEQITHMDFDTRLKMSSCINNIFLYFSQNNARARHSPKCD